MRHYAIPLLLLASALSACHASSPAGSASHAGDAPQGAALALPAAVRAHDAAPAGAVVIELSASSPDAPDVPGEGVAGKPVVLRADGRADAARVVMLAAKLREAGAASVWAALSDGQAVALSAPTSRCAPPVELPPVIDELGVAATPEPACQAGYLLIGAQGARLGALDVCASPQDETLEASVCAEGALSEATLGALVRRADQAMLLCEGLVITPVDGATWGQVVLALELVPGAALASVGPRAGVCSGV
jgi:hypothetical protein